jgi:magnesium-transporting ATPase (P-type)
MGARFWISVVAIFIVSMLIGFVVHGFVLHDDYAQLPNLMRTEEDAQGHFAWMILAHVSMALGFTWIYRKGREAGKPALGQGLRFGAAVAVMMCIPMYLIYYAVQPWPEGIVVKQIVYDVIGMLLLGVVVALVNQDAKTA